MDSINNATIYEKSGEEFQEENELLNFSRSLRMFIAIMGLIFAVIGFVMNLLTIIALSRYKRLHKTTGSFILSLCCADLSNSLMVVPFDSLKLINSSWTQNPALCMIVPFFRYATLTTFVLSITAITINRYILIAHRNFYPKVYTKNGIRIIIGFVWFFSYASMIPTLFGIFGRISFKYHHQNCTIVNDAHGRSAKPYYLILGFIIPVIAIVVCYSRMFWLMKKSEERVQNTSSSTHEATSVTFIRPTKMKQKDRTITRMVFIIFISLTICRLPITLAKMIDPHFKNPGFQCLAYLMAFCHIWVNPVIYGIMNNTYRQAYRNMITACPQSLSKSLTSQDERDLPESGALHHKKQSTYRERNSTTKTDQAGSSDSQHNVNDNTFIASTKEKIDKEVRFQ